MEQDNLNLDITQPDPEWDYYDLWQKAYSLKIAADGLLEYLAAIERADNSTDARLRTKFNEITDLADACDEYLEDCSNFYE